jgi:hypothetical protein
MRWSWEEDVVKEERGEGYSSPITHQAIYFVCVSLPMVDVRLRRMDDHAALGADRLMHG